MPDLLLELFSEEIPARMQAKAAEDLRRMVTDKLVAEGLVYEGAKAFATPRRLTLTVHGIPARQSDLKEERKGPRVGGPDAAIAGFLNATGLASLDEAKVQRDPKKGDFYVALIEKPGRATLDVLADMLPVSIRTFPWPKSMRWGERSARPGALQWVRPLHAIVATFGMETEEPEVVKFAVDGKAIIAGNERVIRARLSDAKFFYESDLKTKLEDRLPKFDQIVFHEKLGTQAERIERIERLAAEIAPLIGANVEKTKRAARLAKADLLTEVVGEFPELQGLMGKYYALAQGEDASVAAASEEHYKPQGPNDRVPTDPVSVAVALADKIDTLVGFWAIDEKPTGSKDPFALRRAALGVIRIVLDNNLRIKLSGLLVSPVMRVLDKHVLLTNPEQHSRMRSQLWLAPASDEAV